MQWIHVHHYVLIETRIARWHGRWERTIEAFAEKRGWWGNRANVLDSELLTSCILVVFNYLLKKCTMREQ